ncbi:uncharacterized protein LOC113649227 [Tachysurus fulvidraco]|uniref:uncharacterized protein LOC113649227 n=1 Tax=Tachysurus fulvidraco TaxID=1234273 RepID=UPI001FEE55A2|nr:uncharacterized protein LOC113649227 [Tachysurus fulvidraco]XP_047667352.1 uncharacterized protein LOC113649227 [Tachysurus fulvidraco]XP_047667353.1 uncharacterized protein LOC113649227 [Tachysurus fulvidraco]XP_047667356.1 uncharacterized protein LOC113649227 [Tachysurus fulvidraco]XP_047667359.1 uncharacterized protein LOC113649227 [Tachysurus fulvidraco]
MDVLQGANAGHQQPRPVVPLAQAGMRGFVAKPHSGPAGGLLLGWSTLHPSDRAGPASQQSSSIPPSLDIETVWKAAAWRAVAWRAVGGLGLDWTLFLMDTKKPEVSGLPVFYHGMFKIWNFFKKQNKGSGTLYWLLEEPLVYGGRLDISSVAISALSRTLISAGIVTLWKLVNILGADLSKVEDLAACMGLLNSFTTGRPP